MLKRHSLLGFYCVAALCTAYAQTDTQILEPLVEKSCRALTVPSGVNLSDLIDPETGTILTGDQAVRLIIGLLNGDTSAGDCDPSSAGYRQRNFPELIDPKTKLAAESAVKHGDFIIHVLRWGSPNSKDQQQVEQQRWYLLHRGEFLRPGRMFGGKRAWFVYIHLNRESTEYTTKYSFTVAKAIPQNEQNLAAFASILAPGTAEKKALVAKTPEKKTPNIWGGRQLDMYYSTADITIDSSKTSPDDQGNVGDPVPLDKTVKIHNEAPPWWDISAGIPIRKMSDLSFEGSSNSLVPKQVDKKSIYGLINLYPLGQQRRDLAYGNFTWWPSLVFGLPASSQPLHKPLFAAGWGPRFVQFYFGAIIQKQTSLPSGGSLAPGSGNACTGWCPQFAFGVNVPIKALQAKLASPPANSGGSGTSQPGVGTASGQPPTK